MKNKPHLTKNISIAALEKQQALLTVQMLTANSATKRELAKAYEKIETTIEDIKWLRKWDKYVKKMQRSHPPIAGNNKAA